MITKLLLKLMWYFDYPGRIQKRFSGMTPVEIIHSEIEEELIEEFIGDHSDVDDVDDLFDDWLEMYDETNE